MAAAAGVAPMTTVAPLMTLIESAGRPLATAAARMAATCPAAWALFWPWMKTDSAFRAANSRPRVEVPMEEDGRALASGRHAENTGAGVVRAPVLDAAHPRGIRVDVGAGVLASAPSSQLPSQSFRQTSTNSSARS